MSMDGMDSADMDYTYALQQSLQASFHTVANTSYYIQMMVISTLIVLGIVANIGSLLLRQHAGAFWLVSSTCEIGVE